MNKERINKVEAFVKQELMKMANYKDNIPRVAEYRIEHSYRVAHIFQEIAKKEGFDEEKAYVAGLLHDIGYSIDYDTLEDYRNHGRDGARIARPLLLSLGYDPKDVEEICYGIAIHVDDKADFEFERTPFAISVGDADNIDRFDAFRLYETVESVDYKNLPIAEQEAFVDKMLNRFSQLREAETGTLTGKKMWEEKIDFQIAFYKKLKNQINNSK